LLASQPLIWLSDFKERSWTCFLKPCKEANLIEIYKKRIVEWFCIMYFIDVFMWLFRL